MKKNVMGVSVFVVCVFVVGIILHGCTGGVEVPTDSMPEISLVGEPTIIVTVGESFTDPGVIAMDEVYGDISSDVVIGGDSVDTANCGRYVITYDVQNVAGNSAEQAKRTVEVILQFDDWEGVSLDDWTDGRWGLYHSNNLDNFEILAYNGGSVLKRGGETTGFGSITWTYGENIRLAFRMKILENQGSGRPYVRLRQDGTSEYRLDMQTSAVRLQRRNDYSAFTTLASGNPFNIGEWVEVEVIMFGSEFWVFQDGEQVIYYNDTSPEAITGKGSYVYNLAGYDSWEYYDWLLFACGSDQSSDPDDIDPDNEPEARAVTLTYVDCPHTSMRISWQTNLPTLNTDLSYSSNLGLAVENYSEVGTARSRKSNTLPDTWLHEVELINLNPGTEYAVAIPSGDDYETFTFKTLPEDAELMFIAGSDSHVWPGHSYNSLMAANEHAAALEPEFILFPGDLWYAGASHDENHGPGTVVANVNRWFDEWHDKVIMSSGRRIPIVPAKGNHDHQYYDDLFPHQDYYGLQFGPDLTVITLNSHHGTSVTGAQRDWLIQTLEEHQDSKWLLVQFHVSPYPNHRDESDWFTNNVRTHWPPIFEEYGVDLVIVGHDHSYHRTYPIYDNAVNHEKGVIYLGVASWVYGPRPLHDRWYLEESLNTDRGFIKFTLSADTNELMAQHLSIDGQQMGTPLLLYKND